MFGRCVSVLAIVGLFASHLAGIPHAHAGMSAAERQAHDATPHVHLHFHRHCHHGQHHVKHRHPGESLNRDAKYVVLKSKNVGLPAGWSAEVHDATAVFLTVQTSASPPTDQKSSSLSNSLLTIDPLAYSETLFELQPASLAHLRPPDAVSDGSNLYLILRTLRN